MFYTIWDGFGRWHFDVFGRFYLRERILDPVSVTRIAFKDKIMGFRIKFFDK